MKKIVILGGGFGGVSVLQHLTDPFVAIVDKNPCFVFTPLLHEFACGIIGSNIVCDDVENVTWVQGTVRKIFLKEKYVQVDNFKVHYDVLVIALGSEVQTYGVSGVVENCYFLKTYDDASKLKEALFNLSIKQLAIIGGGPTGVELAGEIAGIKSLNCQKTLITQADRLLDRNSTKLGEWAEIYLKKVGFSIIKNKSVKEVLPNSVILNDGTTIDSDLTVWTAGVKPLNVEFDCNVLRDKSGRLVVNEKMQLDGFENVYALGDIAGQDLMLAQVAVKQALVVANNISGKNDSFNYEVKGFLISIGRFRAIGEIFGFFIKGWWVWILWHFVYLFQFKSYKKKFQLIFDWLKNI